MNLLNQECLSPRAICSPTKKIEIGPRRECSFEPLPELSPAIVKETRKRVALTAYLRPQAYEDFFGIHHFYPAKFHCFAKKLYFSHLGFRGHLVARLQSRWV